MPANFSPFFRAATSNTPYDYQCRLACGEPSRTAGGDTGRPCESQLISIPTGLGKTAAVVLAWLWNRIHLKRDDWPRRLVICLPMRTLVEQTEGCAHEWLTKLNLLWDGQASPTGKVGLHLLMGGEDADGWDLHPEADAILIGTQDMLLSRALNRGYGMSRYRWPMHFGLLNQDALWVFDETQLIGVGVETSAQLDAFRRFFADACPELVSTPRAFTWWMSATLAEARLATVDQPQPLAFPRTELTATDHKLKPVEQRFNARKPITPSVGLKLSSSAERETTAYAKQVAALIQNQHLAGTFTLVVLNNVARAQAVFLALRALGVPEKRLALIHSRFRSADREHHQRLLFASGERIVVATQAVEAGVDVSARLLITELASWSSLVQRFGRCNRTGSIDNAEIVWIDLADDDQITRPYTAAECAAARTVLHSGLKNVSPRALAKITAPAEPRVIRPVLRRKDLLDLFDTSPDIAGNDLDISRYVRDGDDNDVQVFWRDLAGRAPAPDLPAPVRAELCRVSLARFRAFFDKLGKKNESKAYRWDPLDEVWAYARTVRPGGVYLLDTRVGGYSAELGWTGEPTEDGGAVVALPLETKQVSESNSADHGASARSWITLAEHTRHVANAVRHITTALNLPQTAATVLATAALWHDLGKAHAVFQNALKAATPPPEPTAFYAKSPHRAQPYAAPGFRHELASALAVLLAAPPGQPARDLIAYLVAAHHGKVRLSIRALPGEIPPADRSAARYARGVADGDIIPAAAFAALGLDSPDLALDLGFMELGEGPHGPSWLARSLALRAQYGPFTLAYLETLLRAADMRASTDESRTP
ncbi:MAG: CRISPR-associated endonuclease Cas3'' [Lacunisphaera sp.]|nr:CRISPR-associated endonuclease Cas3'' [Lacunisphaera sp.]